jgi:hypothetical protein
LTEIAEYSGRRGLPDIDIATQDLVPDLALDRHPDLRRDAAGALVVGVDDRDQLVEAETGEGVVAGGEGRLGRVAVAPGGGREAPAKLRSRRQLRQEARVGDADEAVLRVRAPFIG